MRFVGAGAPWAFGGGQRQAAGQPRGSDARLARENWRGLYCSRSDVVNSRSRYPWCRGGSAFRAG